MEARLTCPLCRASQPGTWNYSSGPINRPTPSIAEFASMTLSELFNGSPAFVQLINNTGQVGAGGPAMGENLQNVLGAGIIGPGGRWGGLFDWTGGSASGGGESATTRNAGRGAARGHSGSSRPTRGGPATHNTAASTAAPGARGRAAAGSVRGQRVVSEPEPQFGSHATPRVQSSDALTAFREHAAAVLAEMQVANALPIPNDDSNDDISVSDEGTDSSRPPGLSSDESAHETDEEGASGGFFASLESARANRARGVGSGGRGRPSSGPRGGAGVRGETDDDLPPLVSSDSDSDALGGTSRGRRGMRGGGRGRARARGVGSRAVIGAVGAQGIHPNLDSRSDTDEVADMPEVLDSSDSGVDAVRHSTSYSQRGRGPGRGRGGTRGRAAATQLPSRRVDDDDEPPGLMPNSSSDEDGRPRAFQRQAAGGSSTTPRVEGEDEDEDDDVPPGLESSSDEDEIAATRRRQASNRANSSTLSGSSTAPAAAPHQPSTCPATTARPNAVASTTTATDPTSSEGASNPSALTPTGDSDGWEDTGEGSDENESGWETDDGRAGRSQGRNAAFVVHSHTGPNPGGTFVAFPGGFTINGTGAVRGGNVRVEERRLTAEELGSAIHNTLARLHGL
ncbi:hypothetical protein HDU93_005865 [Gonapodya sp. JEL0774]|nr:hypothetical protein HDU93_005865 [Gonapodya sp. JEL0774]